MVDPPQESNSHDKTGEVPGRTPAVGMPRWVKVSGLALIVVLLFVVMHLVTGAGDHGPGRHLGGQAPLVGVTEAVGPDAGDIG
ncbi:hypothetical protein [Streptomyces sp. S.PNR 29]|uniref:hypothetical protein n=1 Tax=Streptomyces sp. S.PNR 29 TaxID=2973805 RepID=UPI0025B199F2|nr:hypothetical protein [Streptomyces sp. S.PNR 29]MDN0199958.1 hypothetical protein [Streptomyces sp. S.PNR 29]